MSNKNMLVLVLQNLVVFPSTEVTMELDYAKINNTIKESELYFNSEILIVNKEDILEENPTYDDYLNIGVLSKIIDYIKLPNGKIRLTISGIKRVKIIEFYNEDENIHAKYANILIKESDTKTEIAYLRLLKNMIEEYIYVKPYIVSNFNLLNNVNSLDILTDFLVSTLDFDFNKKIEYLLETNSITRSKMLIEDIRQELEIALIEREIDESINIRVDKEQKNIYLRNKLSVIKKELGEDEESDIDELYDKINNDDLPKNIKNKLYDEIKKLRSYGSYQAESGPIKTYIEYMLSLPWNKFDDEITNIKEVENKLNLSHYGLNDVKERILDYIAVKQVTDTDSPIICLVGPPGVGKTSLAIQIANSLNRKYAKISVGGIDDEADIVGHRRTYIGSIPGMIINGIKKAGVSNPVFIIDEIDKMNKNIKGDPASSLLEVLDKEQNKHFVDHYIEEEYDLSKVFFITTANYIENIPNELLDRLEIIEVNSYSKYDKFNIAKDYLIKKRNKDYNMKLKFLDDAIKYIIDNYTYEAGVRDLDRKIDTIFRKVIRNNLEKRTKLNTIDISIVKDFLKDKTVNSYIENNDIGVVNGLSYTPYGGDVLKIESAIYNGSDNLKLTGSLGDVIKESCSIAISYIKSMMDEFGINQNAFKNKEVHIHFPEGAVKKDGPSAGIAITTSLISILLNKKVPSNMAMTGEISLRGNILPIGGVREKVIGAKNRGITTIILPDDNKNDVKKLDEEIKKDLLFIYVKNYKDVFKIIFNVRKKQNNKQTNTIKLEI